MAIKLYFYPTDEHGFPKRFKSLSQGLVCNCVYLYDRMLDPKERTKDCNGKEHYQYVAEVAIDLTVAELCTYSTSPGTYQIPVSKLKHENCRALLKKEAMQIFKSYSSETKVA